MKRESKFSKLSPDLEEVPNAELHAIKGGNHEQDDQVQIPTSSLQPDDEQLLIYGSSTEIPDDEEWDIEELANEEWGEEEWDIQMFGEGGEGDEGEWEGGEGNEGNEGEEPEEPEEPVEPTEPEEPTEEPWEPNEEPHEEPFEEPSEEPNEEPGEHGGDDEPDEESEEEFEEFEQDYRDNMTEEELEIFDSMNVLQQYKYLRNAYNALKAAERYYPGQQTDSIADAFRHAYFSFLNVGSLGASLAELLGTAHEGGGTDLDNEMDLFNNEVGRNAYSSSATLPTVRNLVSSGALVYIKDGVLTPTNQ